MTFSQTPDWGIPFSQAADINAGKAKVEAVCAACHGSTGVSVSDTIPNLAGQKSTYIETQLKALKEGTRKNGAFLFAEVHSAKRDADKKPTTGSDGFFVADQLLFYTRWRAMQAGARTSPTCCAMKIGTTLRSRPPNSIAPV